MSTRKRIAMGLAVVALGSGLAVGPSVGAFAAPGVVASVPPQCGDYSGTTLTKAGQTGRDAVKRIKEVQCLINYNTSYPNWLDQDGSFGTKTYNAVIAVQKHAFPNDSSQWDGQVGTKTWSKLRAGVRWG